MHKVCDGCGCPRPRYTTEKALNGRRPNPKTGVLVTTPGKKNYPLGTKRLCSGCRPKQ